MSDCTSKAEARLTVRRRIAALKRDQRERCDAAICRVLGSLDAYREARQVLAYLALGDEPRLDALLEAAVASGKRVYAPLLQSDWSLQFVRWHPHDGFATVGYGAWQPSSAETPGEGAFLALVPGRAFDRRGVRVGRGKGCYDRTLADFPGLACKIGVAYDCQVFDAVAYEKHDVRMDVVVTESQMIVTAARRPL